MKNLLRYLAFVLMVGSAYAQINLPACQGRDVAKWSNCTGEETLSAEFQYKGEFLDGKRHGFGVMSVLHPNFNGDKYVGEFKDGTFNGQGTYTYVNGNKYVGEYKNSRYNGQGTFTFADGGKYVGEFKDNQRNGEGTFTFANGSKYVGAFKDNKINGQGTYTFADGSKYIGELKDDKRNGQGTEYASNGSIINQGIWAEGDFVRSAPVQQATLSNADLEKLRAEAQSNLPACQGSAIGSWHDCFVTHTYPNGDKYVGAFKDGKRNGQGTLTSLNGDKYVGEYKDDKRNGQGTFTFADGGKYVGEFKDNQRNGEGTFTFATGGKYVGEYKDDKRNGQGTLTFANGAKYVGEYKDDKFNGQGTEYASNGSIISQGIWADDRFLRSAPIQLASVTNQTVPVVAVKPDNSERDRLAAEVQAERKKRQELEEQLRVAQQPNKQRVPSGIERRVALVIGNSTYRVSPLDNPANDATDITNALNKVGFRTTLIRNATLGQMRDATRKFAEQLQSADVALIYFAGHGIESNRKNYMIPVNADLKFEYELTDQAYDAGSWLEMLETIKSSNSERVNIVILDACRNNNLIGSRSLGSGLGRMDAPTGTFLSYSTAPGKVAADGSKGQRNSPFTRHLLNVIQQPGLQIEEAFKEVRRNVSRDTNGAQVPWESTSLVGKFYFTVQR